MRGRWLIAAFAIILSLLCIRQLSYTWYATKVEHEAARLASKPEDEPRILDSLAQHPLDLGIIKYDYNHSKNNEINLGLDLKGGINVILQVSERDLIENLSAKSQNPMLGVALDATDKAQKTNGNVPYVELFFQEFDKIKGGTKYAAADLFGNKNNADKIAYNATDDQVKEVIRKDIEAKVATAYDVISSRINQFGVVEPVIQRLGDKGDGRILVELPGVSDTDRVKKLLQSTAKLEFWQVVRQDPSVMQYFSSVNTEKYKVTNEKGQIIKSLAEVMQPAGSNASFVVDVKDTAVVNRVMQDKGFVSALPANIRGYKYSWANKPMDLGKAEVKGSPKLLEFYVLKGKNGSQEPLITGDKVVSASAERNAGSITNEPVVSMQMNQVGAQEWARITDELKPSATDRNGQGVAIVLDNMVYSAPNIKNQITGGNSQISGNFVIEEAKDLANILQAGSLPASSKIVSAEVVGPSLGQEAINSSLMAFGCAFLLVLIWMVFYYSRAGIYANIALIINLLFLLGFLVSLKATLSLPGIAGIILTLVTGMDANILIYERVKEELRKGKSLRQAVDFAYSWKGAFSAIIDANSTSFITALILFIFGKGPVVGFATTFMIGIFTSTFTAIFITRYFVEGRLSKGKSVPFYTSFTAHWLQNIHVDLLKTRKISYAISIVLSIIALVSIFTKGFDMGIEFQGGRTYTVRFDKNVDPQEISESLGKVFVLPDGEELAPQVKTYGGQNQVKITTAYKADEDGTNVDDEIKGKLYTGLKSYLPAKMSDKDFSEDNHSIGLMSSAKVGPTIADDTTRASYIAVTLALVAIFFYLIIMFKRWQFSLSTIIALAHDVIIVLGVFSLFKGIMPFNMEIDQAFIAAILTVIGFSMNDSIIILDRIRENLTVEKKHNLYDIINISTSETLSRTINTSLSTFLIVLIIFAFGGESIKGFMFAKLIGIVIGTFSSIFVASPLLYDFTRKGQMNK